MTTPDPAVPNGQLGKHLTRKWRRSSEFMESLTMNFDVAEHPSTSSPTSLYGTLSDAEYFSQFIVESGHSEATVKKISTHRGCSKTLAQLKHLDIRRKLQMISTGEISPNYVKLSKKFH